MSPGWHSLLFLLTAIVLAFFAVRRPLFWAFAVGSLLSAFFYGSIWWLQREAYLRFHEQYGDLGIYPATYQPRGWHSIFMDFQTEALTVIWGIAAILAVTVLFFVSAKR